MPSTISRAYFIMYGVGSTPVIDLASTTAQIDFGSGTISFDPFNWFDKPVNIHDGEILSPGSYYRPSVSGYVSATIDPGLVGAYMVMDYGSNNGIGMFAAWNVKAINPTDNIYLSTDLDHDGLPGWTFQDSVLAGHMFEVDMVVPTSTMPIPPAIYLFSTGLLALVRFRLRNSLGNIFS